MLLHSHPAATTDAASSTAPAVSSAQALQVVLVERGPREAAAALATWVAQGLACRRVAVGWRDDDRVQVLGLSHGAQLASGSHLPLMSEVMQEAMTQGQTLCLPRVPDGAVRITQAHRQFMKQEGVSALITVPLAIRGQVLGALTCERDGQRFSPADLILLEEVAQTCAPLLQLHQEAARGAWARWRQTWRSRWQGAGPRGQRLWLVGGSVAALLGATLLALPWPHHIAAHARVEGAQQRVLTAPLDGFLQQSLVKPGDTVRAGQLLVQLADEDLVQQVRAHEAEVKQQDNAFVDAFTRGDRAQAAMAQARAAQARAQLERATRQLARTRLVAPFDGVVIAGDLSQRLGSPVQRTEVLLKVAPSRDWHVVLEVDERQIAQVQPGQTARLLLAALPDQPIEVRVSRVLPTARTTDGRQRFEVLALPARDTPSAWRPGMEGVAHISLPEEPLASRWARTVWRDLRWLSWSWW